MPGSRARRSGAVLAYGRPSSPRRRHSRPAGLTARPRHAIDRRPGPRVVRQDRAMPLRLDSRAPDFAERFRTFLATKREVSADVEAAVRAIIADVAARGDRAVIELTRQFDRFDPAKAGLKVAADEIEAGGAASEIEAAVAACNRRALDALIFARDRIEAYHRRQLPADERFTDALGVEL